MDVINNAYLHDQKDDEKTSHDPHLDPRKDIADGIRGFRERRGAIDGRGGGVELGLAIGLSGRVPGGGNDDPSGGHGKSSDGDEPVE